MIEPIIADVLLVVAALVVVLAAVACAWGALIWSKAIDTLQQARMHAVAANASQRTLDETNRAIDDLNDRMPPRADYVPPSEDEIREELRRQRADARAEEQPEYTTLGNEGVEEAPPIPPGGFYREQL